MPHLPPKQALICEHIRNYTNKRKLCPSFRDIQEAMGYRSPNAIVEALHALRGKGLVTWEYGTHRTLRICEENWECSEMEDTVQT